MTGRALKGCTCRFCGPLPGGKKRVYTDDDYYEAMDGDRWEECQMCGADFRVAGQALGNPGFICPDCDLWESREASRKYDEDQKRRKDR